MLFTRIDCPIRNLEMSKVIASGRSLANPTHCNVRNTVINLPPAITPREDPVNLTGSLMRTVLVSLNSKKSTC